MNSSFVRKAGYLTVGTLLILVSAMLIGTLFNVQPARAAQASQEGGGGVLTIRDLIAQQLSLKHIVTIRTTTKTNNVDTYIVHPQINADYYASSLGDQFVCLIRADDVKKNQVCLPFTAIATISFREQ